MFRNIDEGRLVMGDARNALGEFGIGDGFEAV
jgi:hypothetical protein